MNKPGIKLLDLVKENVLSLKDNKLNILDIGFNDPGSFIKLYHFHGLNLYKGIDLISEKDFRINISFEEESISEDRVLTEETIAPYAQYKLLHKYELEKYQLLEKEKFESIFQFKFETKISDYFETEDFQLYNPNLIIISDFLHLFNKQDAENIFNRSITKLVTNGLMYIKVYNSKYTNGYDHISSYSPDDIENLESKLKILHKEIIEDKTLLIGLKNW
jgi:hypothetical protein